jgi:IS30 family transposase
LVEHVEQSLRAERSPDVIAARLKLDHPDDHRMRLSIETIYRWVYRDAASGGTLFNCLFRSHRKRRRQRRYWGGRELNPSRVSSDTQPELVATRQRFGDWEGDTVQGAKGSGHITTHVERKSRYLVAAKFVNKTVIATADAVNSFQAHPVRTAAHAHSG